MLKLVSLKDLIFIVPIATLWGLGCWGAVRPQDKNWGVAVLVALIGFVGVCLLLKELAGRILFRRVYRGITQYGTFVIGLNGPSTKYVERVQHEVAEWCEEFNVCTLQEALKAFDTVAIEVVAFQPSEWGLNYCPWATLSWDDDKWIRAAVSQNGVLPSLPVELMHRILRVKMNLVDSGSRRAALDDLGFDMIG